MLVNVQIYLTPFASSSPAVHHMHQSPRLLSFLPPLSCSSPLFPVIHSFAATMHSEEHNAFQAARPATSGAGWCEKKMHPRRVDKVMKRKQQDSTHRPCFPSSMCVTAQFIAHMEAHHSLFFLSLSLSPLVFLSCALLLQMM